MRSRFWARQFSNDVTTNQSIFDVVFGVVAPFLCFVFDPIVFNNGFGGTPFSPDLARFKLLVYFFSGLAIITLTLWLILRGRSGRINAIIAGVLLSGSFFSLLIGILILPLSILGLILALIGIFGFTPGGLETFSRERSNEESHFGEGLSRDYGKRYYAPSDGFIGLKLKELAGFAALKFVLFQIRDHDLRA